MSAPPIPAGAQASPSPAPPPRAAQNAEIVNPLTEIGRVNRHMIWTPSSTYTIEQSEALEDHVRLASLFATFSAEDFIREDLKKAAARGNAAIRLGGCTGI